MAEGNHRFPGTAFAFAPGVTGKGEEENVLRRALGELESQMARAMEQLVAGDGFGELMATFTSNTVALTRLGADFMDMTLRNFRVAGRADIDRLARQLARTEDKLELVLQAVERLEDTKVYG